MDGPEALSPDERRFLEESWQQIEKEPNRPPRRQHHVPRFYLREWADEKSQLLAVDREGRLEKLAVADAAVVNDLYTFGPSGKRSTILERVFARIEGAIRPMLEEAIESGRVSDEARFPLSLFMGLQTVRGIDTRAVERATIDKTFKKMLGEASHEDRLNALEELIQRGRITPRRSSKELDELLAASPDSVRIHPGFQGALLPEILEMGLKNGHDLWHREWTIHRSNTPLVTSDRPVVRNRWNPRRGFTEVFWALTPHVLLSVRDDDPATRELSPLASLAVNLVLDLGAERWTFVHPSEPRADEYIADLRGGRIDNLIIRGSREETAQD